MSSSSAVSKWEAAHLVPIPTHHQPNEEAKPKAGSEHEATKNPCAQQRQLPTTDGDLLQGIIQACLKEARHGFRMLGKNPSWHLQRHERELEQTQPYKEPMQLQLLLLSNSPRVVQTEPSHDTTHGKASLS